MVRILMVGTAMLLCAHVAWAETPTETPKSIRDVCNVQGEVTGLATGKYSDKIEEGGQNKKLVVKYTELSVRVEKSSLLRKESGDGRCQKAKAGEVRKYGLCQPIEIHYGDIIKADTGGWPGGPDCLVNVEIVKKSKKAKG